MATGHMSRQGMEINEDEVEGVVGEVEVSHAATPSPSHVKQPPFLDTTAKQLQDIQANLDILQENRYKDWNEIVAYIDDVQFSQNEILEQLASMRCSQRRSNERMGEIEAHLAHIDYHIHEDRWQQANLGNKAWNPPP